MEYIKNEKIILLDDIKEKDLYEKKIKLLDDKDEKYIKQAKTN